MKVRCFLSVLVIVVFSIMMTSCFLFPKVQVEDTKNFINDFESTITDPTSEVEGENGTLAMGATSDFFNKGGTSKGGFSLNFLDMSNFLRPTVKSPQLLLGDEYGTFVYDSTNYDFILTDPNTPANGYAFQWIYTDTTVVPAENHAIELLFDSITYYAGDADESTPTRLYIAMKADTAALMFLNMHATFTTLSDEGGEWYSPTAVETHLEITDETALELDYVGHEDGDTTIIIDSLRTKIEDFINDEWVEYTVKMNDDETTDFTMENNEGWFMAINAEEPNEIDTIFTSIDFTGEVQKDGTHAADLTGIMTTPYETFLYRLLMYVTYPDATIDTVDIIQPYPQVK